MTWDLYNMPIAPRDHLKAKLNRLNYDDDDDGGCLNVDDVVAKNPKPLIPKLLITSTPSTVFDSGGFKQNCETSLSTMSGLTFQLQSGIHKKTITADSIEISLRDLRNEAFEFLKEINPDKGCEALRDHIILYRHDLRSINILQLITTSADIADGALVEVVLSCEFLILLFFFHFTCSFLMVRKI
ncbi:unnamed protein product [Caenorhabditis bovis]|uniref:Serine/threonine-protein kinase D1-3-like ubiquitin-like domain-containing protein n=1 Tax=Caenorhabditis bovis TaxID=2654633 RepID=A0A8S1EGW0_9PELO|nr:unnamed protein product [Caenorhabditis bovis]